MDLEIKSQPFTEKQLARIKRGLRSGKVRRFGAIANHQKLKFSHNALIAWKLKSMGEGIAEKLREKTYISHIYLRRANRLWPYSFYTMVHAHNQDELQLYVQEIRRLLKHPAYKALNTVKEFKKTPFLPSHCQCL
jgi:DNA-binding Lrp family transcriptional regulator